MAQKKPARGAAIASALMIPLGGGMIWMALRDDPSAASPAWIGLTTGGLFLLAGLAVLSQFFWHGAPARRNTVSGVLAALIVTGFAAMASWIAFGPGERRTGTSVEGVPFIGLLPDGFQENMFRAAFGLGALMTLAIAVTIWSSTLRPLVPAGRSRFGGRALTLTITLALVILMGSVSLQRDRTARGRTGNDPVFAVSFEGGLTPGAVDPAFDIQGDEIRRVSGPTGSALFIGGTEDWVDCELPPGIDLSGSATLELWFKAEDWINPYANGSGAQTIVHVAPFTFSLAMISRQTNENGGGYRKIRIPRARVGEASLTGREAPVSPDAWTHVALVMARGSSEALLYVDGRPVASRNIFRRRQPGETGTMRIGTWHKANQAFRGSVDEIRVYDYALTRSMIESHATDPSEVLSELPF